MLDFSSNYLSKLDFTTASHCKHLTGVIDCSNRPVLAGLSNAASVEQVLEQIKDLGAMPANQHLRLL